MPQCWKDLNIWNIPKHGHYFKVSLNVFPLGNNKLSPSVEREVFVLLLNGLSRALVKLCA